MSDAQLMRQLDMLPPDALRRDKASVSIVGCGGIGSSVGLFLAKMGIPRFHLYDADIIQEHNISNQMFPRDSINRKKVEVIAEEMGRMSPSSRTVITPHDERCTLSTNFGTNIVVSCLDSMESRKDVWKAVRNSYCDLYIDARMGAEVAKVYTVKPMLSYDDYEGSLKQSNHTIACTAQAIAYNVAMIASIVGSNVRRFLTEMPVPRLVIGDSLNLQFIKLNGEC